MARKPPAPAKPKRKARPRKTPPRTPPRPTPAGRAKGKTKPGGPILARLGPKRTGRRPEYQGLADCAHAERLATLGLPRDDIAYAMGINPTTLFRWQNRYRELAEALKRGDTAKRMGLLLQMVTSAGAGNVATQIFLAKNWLGMTDRQTVETNEMRRPITVVSKVPRPAAAATGPKQGQDKAAQAASAIMPAGEGKH